MPEFIPTPFEMIILNTPKKFLNNELKRTRKNVLSRRNYYKNYQTYQNTRNSRKEARKEYNKEYILKNADKLKEKRKIHAEQNPEYTKEVCRRYRENQRKNNLEEYRRRNRESKKKYYLNNYEKCIKASRKKAWKERGLNMENFEEIYERYITTTHCDLCSVELTEDKVNTKTTRCMDHSHVTGEFRNVVCISCNGKLPENT